ncbi:MAG: carotenoid biosynthesis protein [Nitrospira sp.]|nr:carotenoid biosynthesis protein [Nitrospira sp.]
MDLLILLGKTLLLRPYVFFFLAVALVASSRLLGRRRTVALFGITWLTAFVCEFSSTRIGFPFGDYYYTGSTVGEELYLSNIPFMDSLSFTFLLFASYCLALWLLLPAEPSSEPSCRVLLTRESLSWPVIGLTCLLFMLIDVVIDPAALRGERWFLGRIYGYPDPGVYFGVPLANFAGWFVVGLMAMTVYRALDRQSRRLPAFPDTVPVRDVLLGCGLYYGVLLFNLVMTFWIGEWLLGLTGCLLYVPVTVLAVWKFRGLSASAPSSVCHPRHS